LQTGKNKSNQWCYPQYHNIFPSTSLFVVRISTRFFRELAKSCYV